MVDIYVEAYDVNIILCDHPSFSFEMIDGEYHNEICTFCGYTVVGEHVYDGVCDDYCNECGYERVAPHAYSDSFTGDEFGHWHVCELCGEIDMLVDHVYDGNSDGECNDCGYVRFFRGDVDGDGDVDSDDSVRIVYYIFFGGVDYPVNQSLDFNGDGEENTDDSVYLLYHIFYNDLYPLH